jgi:hypothetical protein
MPFRILEESKKSGSQHIIWDNLGQAIFIIRPELALELSLDDIQLKDEIWYMAEYASEPIEEGNTGGVLFLNVVVPDPYRASIDHEAIGQMIEEYLEYNELPPYSFHAPANIFTEKYFSPESNFEFAMISINPDRFVVKTQIPEFTFEIIDIDNEPSFNLENMEDKIIFRVTTTALHQEPAHAFYFILRQKIKIDSEELEELDPGVYVLFFMYEKYHGLPFEMKPANNFTKAIFPEGASDYSDWE